MSGKNCEYLWLLAAVVQLMISDIVHITSVCIIVISISIILTFTVSFMFFCVYN